MTELLIRDAEASDIPALHGLIESAYRGEASRAGWTTEADLLGGQRTDADELGVIIADPDQFVLTAWDRSELVACVRVLKLSADAGYFGMLSVRPMLQASGLGRRMVAAAESAMAGRFGASRSRIQVFPQRQSLIAWYERLGYVATGETAPFPYDDPRMGLPLRDDLSFIILEKPLG
jgi:ribosomal protein S18 acetylase RimI-like enzyme